ncbi:MAG TPA: T9SS type A sorting domain-containing protein [bacterium]|jgi:hypothetical protein
MQIRLQHLVFAALLIFLVSLAYGINYTYLSDQEMSIFGDRIKFWTSDTLQGSVHSNSLIAIEGSPQFYGQVSTTERDFWRGPGYNPGFHGFMPIFRAPRVEIPSQLTELRRCAMIQDLFFSDAGKSYRVHLRGDTALVSRWWTGTPFDSSDSWAVPLGRRRCMFFDRPLDIEGHMSGEVSIGCSYNMRLLDNVVYDDADLTHGVTVPPESPNYLMLASEADIKIANTPANGRENSNGLGINQSDPDLTSIAISAALYALGESFTFEQQNDLDSGYVYENPVGTPHRDDRGSAYVYGSLTQKRRGSLHRSTNISTGYFVHYRWDPRFVPWSPPGVPSYDDNTSRNTDTLNFGDVPVGQTVWDTGYVYVGVECNLGSVTATSPFWATRVPPFYARGFNIPARFTPTHTGTFSGVLYISTPYHYFQIVLRGRGLPGGHPSPVVFDVSPNPFNLTTTLHYTLSEPGAVKVTLFDVLGRSVKQIDLSAVEAGDHSINLSADGLATGVYFVRLQAGQHLATRKVLLLK